MVQAPCGSWFSKQASISAPAAATLSFRSCLRLLLICLVSTLACCLLWCSSLRSPHLLAIDLLVSCEIQEVLGWSAAAGGGDIVCQHSEEVVRWSTGALVLQGHLLASKWALLVGPGCGIEEGGLDHAVVSFGVGLRFSEGHIGKESLVPATDTVTFGSPDSSILHGLEPSGVAHLLMPEPLSEVWDHALELSIGS